MTRVNQEKRDEMKQEAQDREKIRIEQDALTKKINEIELIDAPEKSKLKAYKVEGSAADKDNDKLN